MTAWMHEQDVIFDAKYSIAKNMLKLNLPIEVIEESTGIDRADLEKLFRMENIQYPQSVG